VVAYIGIAMPVFWFALLLQESFGARLHLLPVYGQHYTDETGFTSLEVIEDYIIHLILPATVLAFLYIGQWSRYLRSSMLEVLKQDYIRTARAKGLSSTRVLFGHAFRNGLIPLVTIVALNFGGIIGGAVVTETVFAWPGMGQLFIDSLNHEDYPLLMAYLVLGAASVIAFNLLADVLYGLIDPRIRYS
jgi:peptide/nickel transport system permease protein